MLAASWVATAVARTLMTATAGVSGPAPAGARDVVSEMIRPVRTVPVRRAERPRVRPPAKSP